MLSKLEHFIKRLRCRAFFFDHKNADTIEENEIYGFKSENTPPQHEGLAAFEEKLYAMIKSIKFKQTSSTFQARLANDAKKIRDSPMMLIPADKTTNLYEVSVDNYSKLLKNNITTAY